MIFRDGVASSLSELVMLSTIILNACAVSPSGSAIILCTPSSPPLTIPGSNGKEPRYGTDNSSAAESPPPFLKISRVVDQFPSSSEIQSIEIPQDQLKIL